MKYLISKCPKCGQVNELMFSNNPLVSANSGICWNCVNSSLDKGKLNHVDMFCRTYNIPFNPELWMKIIDSNKSSNPWKDYSTLFFDDTNNRPNLAYDSATKDVWTLANEEWEKIKTQEDLIHKITPIKESYIKRAELRWGAEPLQYTLEQLMKMDNLYHNTLKSCNVVNPLQKEAVKMMCKLQCELDKAVYSGDTKALKEYAASYKIFADQANLDEMIDNTKTDDITTVSELYEYMEQQGFHFKFFDGVDRDEVDNALTDINNSNRRLIMDSMPQIQQMLEDMIKKRKQSLEEANAAQAAQETSINNLLNLNLDEEAAIDTESDSEIKEQDFAEEDKDGEDINGIFI